MRFFAGSILRSPVGMELILAMMREGQWSLMSMPHHGGMISQTFPDGDGWKDVLTTDELQGLLQQGWTVTGDNWTERFLGSDHPTSRAIEDEIVGHILS